MNNDVPPEAWEMTKNGRRPQRNRLIARKAADDIRGGKFETIREAASAYFIELVGELKRNKDYKDNMIDFEKYIYEDLKSGPKSLRVFFIMAERKDKRKAALSRKTKERLQRELFSRFSS
ncbi:MAG: hypothetical protein ACK4VZ_04460 [Paracoccaceae bacterium]